MQLITVLIATLSKDMNELGTRVGLNFALSGILGLFCMSPFLSLSQPSSLIGPTATPITGAILTDRYYWKNASLFSGVSNFYSCIFIRELTYVLIRLLSCLLEFWSLYQERSIQKSLELGRFRYRGSSIIHFSRIFLS